MVRVVAGRSRRTYYCFCTVLEVHAVVPTARLRRQEVESLDARDKGKKLDRWMEHSRQEKLLQRGLSPNGRPLRRRVDDARTQVETGKSIGEADSRR